MRQALFDRLMHAPWAGPGLLEGARVLDVFAGTGALGLEALSRGAAWAGFMEQDRAALAVLRANVATCRAGERCRVMAGDARTPPAGEACEVIFMDPPYGSGLAEAVAAALAAAGWMAPGTLVVLEAGRGAEAPEFGAVLARFEAGAASVFVVRN